MKHLIATIVLTTGLAAGPVMAGHQGSNLLNKENVGGAIGAAVGGLAGNKIVDGKGQSAATAAGAVGGWLLGKNIAHNYGGAKYRSPKHSGYSKPGRGHQSYGHRDTRLNRINDTFVARTTSNVRSGPGTGYSVIGRLHRREPVYVVGKVQHRNWYMVRTHGRQGFVYAPLLAQARHGYQAHSRSSGRHRSQTHRGWNR